MTPRCDHRIGEAGVRGLDNTSTIQVVTNLPDNLLPADPPAQGDWNPAQYHQFANERTQPFLDLLALVRTDTPIARAVDLGCGSGELTALAADALGVADCRGVDSSPAMLAAAAAHRRPGLEFAAGDIADFTSDHDHQLVLANASLQWVPDHAAVLARWRDALAPGGQLAVQVPSNARMPSHTVAAAVARTSALHRGVRA